MQRPFISLSIFKYALSRCQSSLLELKFPLPYFPFPFSRPRSSAVPPPFLRCLHSAALSLPVRLHSVTPLPLLNSANFFFQILKKYGTMDCRSSLLMRFHNRAALQLSGICYIFYSIFSTSAALCLPECIKLSSGLDFTSGYKIPFCNCDHKLFEIESRISS